MEAAPLMCAGMTTFNALRNSGAGPGELVAILGLGGLGHLGVQFAAKMGFRTVGIARGADKEPLARQLGAFHYIDSQSQDPAAELAKLGGARVILATVTNADAMQATLGGLGPNGTIHGDRGRAFARRSPLFSSYSPPVGGRLVFRHAIDSQDTLELQRAHRGPFDERSLSRWTR